MIADRWLNIVSGSRDVAKVCVGKLDGDVHQTIISHKLLLLRDNIQIRFLKSTDALSILSGRESPPLVAAKLKSV